MFLYELIFTGDEIFIPEHRVCELSIEILPTVLVTDIKSEEAQILQLTGGKGNSLALLSSIDSKEVRMDFSIEIARILNP